MLVEDKIAVKPFLKWVGGKSQLLTDLAPLIPHSFDNYFEPFLGGGALFFHLQPNKGTLNDVNKKLITTYSVIKENIDDLISELRVLESEYLGLSDGLRKDFYYDQRQQFNNSKDDMDTSSKLIFLNKTCFNGMYRENSKGKFNVPQGRYKNPKILNEDNLRSVSKLLKNTRLMSGSFEKAVANAGKNDFVYFDPPYQPISKTSSFTSYSKNDFNEDDQKKLRDCFVDLTNRGCKVMLSNSNADLIRDLYSNFKIIEVNAKRSINSKAAKRGEVKELVRINY